LALLALEIENAMVAEGGNSSQADPIAASLDGQTPGVNDCVCHHVTS
jgi:hypothetical protein